MRYQPQGLLRAGVAAIKAGLRLAILPGVHRGYDAAAMRPPAQAVGTRQVTFPGGVAAGFGAAIGAGSTDKITATVSGAFPAAGRTYFFAARRNGNGGGNLGRLFDKTNGSAGQFLYWSNVNSTISYGFYLGGSERAVQIPTPEALGEWFAVAVTHFQNGTTSSIKAYTRAGVVANIDLTGTLNDAATTPYCIGNRNSDNARGWDGAISHAYVFDSILSEDAIQALFANPNRDFFELEEDPDEIAVAGADASATWTEGNETNSAAASVRVSAAATWTESAESNQVALRASVNATAAWIEANEQTAIFGTIGAAVAASAAWAESNETVAVAGRADVIANAAWAESSETSAAQITVGAAVAVSANWAEKGETNAVASRLDIRLSAAWVEAGDSFILRANSGNEQDDIDALLVPPRQTVVFEGSRRVVAFEGSKRVVSFEGSKRLVEFQ